MRRGTSFWGLLLILLGVLFLLDNADLLGDIGVRGLFFPIFLIIFGFVILYNYLTRPASNIEQLIIPVDDAEIANIRIDHGAGRLLLKAGIDQDELISGKFGGGVEFSKEVTGTRANIRLKMPNRWFPFFWIPGTILSKSWDVDLKRSFPWIISLNTGAGETNLDLSDLLVQKVVLKTGVSSTKINLPNFAGYTSLHIEAGVASVEVHVPAHVAAQIRTEVGLANVNIDRERFAKKGEVYISGDYDIAENKADIFISSGISSVSVN
jgi:hypothetical protein